MGAVILAKDLVCKCIIHAASFIILDWHRNVTFSWMSLMHTYTPARNVRDCILDWANVLHALAVDVPREPMISWQLYGSSTSGQWVCTKSLTRSELWKKIWPRPISQTKQLLQWRHNECDRVWNHLPRDWLLNRLFKRRSKKTSKPASLPFVRGIHRWSMNSPHRGPVTRKMSPFENVIMHEEIDITAAQISRHL